MGVNIRNLVDDALDAANAALGDGSRNAAEQQTIGEVEALVAGDGALQELAQGEIVAESVEVFIQNQADLGASAASITDALQAMAQYAEKIQYQGLWGRTSVTDSNR